MPSRKMQTPVSGRRISARLEDRALANSQLMNSGTPSMAKVNINHGPDEEEIKSKMNTVQMSTPGKVWKY